MSNINDFVIENGVLKKHTGSGGDVVIPEGVTSIGRWAFAGSSLENVMIPQGVTSIGENAFYRCSSMKSVDIPTSVTDVGSYAFCECGSLSRVVIPESVTSIGEGAFCGCNSLADGDGFIIVRGVLYGYNGKGGNAAIPDGITKICNQAFSGCSELTSITVPQSVTDIGEGAFHDCGGLADKEGFVIVRGILFGYFGPGGSIAIPKGVTRIDNAAFSGCSSLTSVTFPESLTEIGENAFECCDRLTSIAIPVGVKKIDDRAFFLCSGLTSVDLPEGLTSIRGSAFNGCSNLTEVMIPESVTSIGNYAFQSTGITEAVIHEKVEALGSNAFRKCGGLKTVTVLGPARIGDCAFEDCTSLETVVFKSKDAEIDWSAFRGTKPAVIIGEGDAMHCCACGSRGYSDNSAWYNNGACSIEYDKELILNGPTFKYRLPARLLGAISRLHDPINLGAAERQGYVDLLKKNAKKLPELIDPLGCPWMSELLENEGIPTAAVKKAAEKKSVKKKAEVPAETPKPKAELKSDEEYETLLQPIRRYAADALCMITDEMLSSVKLTDGSAAPGELVRYVIAAYAVQEKVPARRIAEADEAASLLDLPSFVSLIHNLYVRTGESTSLIPVICRYGDAKTLGLLTRAFPKWKGASGKSSQKALLYAIHLSDLKEAQKWISTNFNRNIKGLLFEEYLDAAKLPPYRLEYFLKTPQLACYAEKLVWMQGGNTFIVKAGTPVDASGSPVELSDKPIVMAHVLDLPPETVEAWRRYLTSGGIEQLFVQMWEPVYKKEDIRPDRYRDIILPRSVFLRQKRRGIRIYNQMLDMESYYSEEVLSIRGFDVEYRLGSMAAELTSIIPKNKKWRRRENSVIAYLDYVACEDLVRKDDPTVEPLLMCLPQEKIMSLIELARSSNAVNVTAMLLELNNRNFPDFDRMAEFTLDEL